ncbi:MAG: PP2C family protein-serine/threonine phosphatase [Acidobacteriia bacterium]|nr:PP2C family protein-serine/threonine phosphatase [Terriglobia bacterium]
MPTPQSSGRSPWAARIESAGRAIAGAVERAGTFWARVSEGMAANQLWGEFKAEARFSYDFYAQDVDWAAVDQHRGGKRKLYAARALAWALLMKLSPSRRVFLLLTLAYVAIDFVASHADSGVLIASAALVLLLALELADRVTMKRDLEIAREIQRWLVPAAPPEVAGIDLAFTTRPANTVSGDYYDAIPREGGRLLLVVADVAGKSIPAALLMATIQASLRTLAASSAPLGEVVLGMNRYACANSQGGLRFTTAFLGELEPATGALRYINAGHNPPVLRRATGGMERLEAGGLPLGVMAGARYEEGAAVVAAGDLLVVFTDGVVEAENERQEEYGEPRLLALVEAMRPATAAEALKQVMVAVDGFVGHTRQHDDITALVLLRR